MDAESGEEFFVLSPTHGCRRHHRPTAGVEPMDVVEDPSYENVPVVANEGATLPDDDYLWQDHDREEPPEALDWNKLENCIRHLTEDEERRAGRLLTAGFSRTQMTQYVQVRQSSANGAHSFALTMLCMWWRQVAVPVLVLSAGCRCWSGLCTWWRQVAGAGAVRLCGVAVPVLHVVECWCWCCEAVPPGAGAARGGDRLVPVLVLGVAGGAVSWLCRLPHLVPGSRMSTGCGILPSYLGLCWCNCQIFCLHCFTHLVTR